MINRRHIRVKVMQSVYALTTSNSDNLVKEENFLKNSIEKMYDLYVLMIDTLPRIQNLAKEQIEISKKKHFATEEDLNPNTKFINNRVLRLIQDSVSFQTYKEEHDLNNWYVEEKYIRTIYEHLMKSTLYKKYIENESTSFKEDVKFIINVYSDFIAPNEKLADYFEDLNISWVDDIPFVNTWVVKTLQGMTENKSLVLGTIYKDQDDKEFVSDLFRKTVLKDKEFEKDIADKTPNWERDRIAGLDIILIKMGICEFLNFPSIPTKASINEYIELAKDYSTPKSGFFINGVLDMLCKEFEQTGRLNKIGRGRI
jgi:transcription antitermination protein NusB